MIQSATQKKRINKLRCLTFFFSTLFCDAFCDAILTSSFSNATGETDGFLVCWHHELNDLTAIRGIVGYLCNLWKMVLRKGLPMIKVSEMFFYKWSYYLVIYVGCGPFPGCKWPPGILHASDRGFQPKPTHLSPLFGHTKEIYPIASMGMIYSPTWMVDFLW